MVTKIKLLRYLVVEEDDCGGGVFEQTVIESFASLIEAVGRADRASRISGGEYFVVDQTNDSYHDIDIAGVEVA